MYNHSLIAEPLFAVYRSNYVAQRGKTCSKKLRAYNNHKKQENTLKLN